MSNSGSAAKKKNQYAYYNNLLFLTETPVTTSSNTPINTRTAYVDEDSQTDDAHTFAWDQTYNGIKNEDKSEVESGDAQSDPDYNSCSSWCPKKNKRVKNMNRDDENESDDAQHDSAHDTSTSWEPKRNKNDVQIERAMNRNMEKNILDEDDDRLFFMSLVKEFKKIPETMQIQAKLNILKVIQGAQCSNDLTYQ